MAKQRKKRNKKYTGADAAMTRPSVTRMEAVNRGKITQWWHDHRRTLKPIMVISGVALLIIWLVWVIIDMIVGT